MKNLKNHNLFGFSFIEVLTAISIAGLMLSSTFILQNTAFFNLMRYSQNLRAMVALNNELIIQHRNQLVSGEIKNKVHKTVENINISYNQLLAPKNSSLKKCCDLYIEKFNASWQQLGVNQYEEIITFQYIPQKKNQEKVKE